MIHEDFSLLLPWLNAIGQGPVLEQISLNSWSFQLPHPKEMTDVFLTEKTMSLLVLAFGQGSSGFSERLDNFYLSMLFVSLCRRS